MNLRMVCGLSFALMVIGIFYLGAQPVAVGLFPAPYDKIAHFLAFFLMTTAAGLAGLHCFPGYLFLLGLALGMSDEIHQLYLPGRSAGWDDFLVDFLAVSIAVWSMPAMLKLFIHGINRLNGVRN